MTIDELVFEAHGTAIGKGWWDPYLPKHGILADRTRAPDVPPDGLAAKLALVHSEVSEALECVRDRDMYARTNGAKPEGLPSELADIVIRVADLCGALGIDLDAAVREKLDYNRTRTHRHGGRAL